MDKLIDDTLERLRAQNVRGMLVFMDDDEEFYSASSALNDKEAVKFLTRLIRDEAQRQGCSPREVLNILTQKV